MWAIRASMRRRSVMSSCVVTQPPFGIGRCETAIERPSLQLQDLVGGGGDRCQSFAPVLLGVLEGEDALGDAVLDDLAQVCPGFTWSADKPYICP